MILFSTRIWRQYYNEINELTLKLNRSRAYDATTGHGIRLTYNEKNMLAWEIKQLTTECHTYLNRCGLYPAPAKWQYDPKEEKTWASSPKFKYGHLMV